MNRIIHESGTSNLIVHEEWKIWATKIIKQAHRDKFSNTKLRKVVEKYDIKETEDEGIYSISTL